MAEKGAEAPHHTKGAGFLLFIGGPHRLAVVLDKHDVPPADNFADTVEIVRVPEQVHGQDHSGPLGQCLRQAVKVEIERVEIDVDEADFESVLVKRQESRAPGYRWHD